jgi:cytidine deaminase
MICPRCKQDEPMRFYGPCGPCREELKQFIRYPELALPDWTPEEES